MSSFATHVGMQAVCPHMGTISVTPGQPRVKLSGQPVATMADAYLVAGCPFQIPVGAGTKPQPCVRVQWTVPAARVRSGGQPWIVQQSVGLCLSAEQIPQGPPQVLVTQTRVRAT